MTRVSLSDTVELSVTIESTEPVDVQWLFLFETPVNESLITNAESNGAIVRSTLTLRNISRDQLGLYFITVSSSAGQDGVSITVELNIRKWNICRHFTCYNIKTIIRCIYTVNYFTSVS